MSLAGINEKFTSHDSNILNNVQNVDGLEEERRILNFLFIITQYLFRYTFKVGRSEANVIANFSIEHI